MARPKEIERKTVFNSTRAKLLKAAAAAIARDGYDGANINDISTTAGFAKGTIYNYFPSKHELMKALITDIASRHVNFISQAVREGNDPPQRLERFFESGFLFINQNHPESQVMITSLYGHDNELKGLMYESYSPLFQLLAQEIVSPGIQAGQFRQIDPLETAGLLMTTYLGTASQVNEEGQPWLSPNTVADFALHALRAFPEPTKQ